MIQYTDVIEHHPFSQVWLMYTTFR